MNLDFIPRNNLGIEKLLALSDGITCEKLSTKSMIMKKELSKSISDASFSEILRQLEYKTRYKNKLFYQIDRDVNASMNIMFEGLKLYMKEVRM